MWDVDSGSSSKTIVSYQLVMDKAMNKRNVQRLQHSLVIIHSDLVISSTGLRWVPILM